MVRNVETHPHMPYTQDALNRFKCIRQANHHAEAFHLYENMRTHREDFVLRVSHEALKALEGFGTRLIVEGINPDQYSVMLDQRIGPLIELLNFAPPRDYSLNRSIFSRMQIDHHFETYEHAERVESYAAKMAKYADLHLSAGNRLELAAKMHDLGKVVVPAEELIDKPTRLEGDEDAIMHIHQQIGYLMLKSIHAYNMVAEIMRYTHVENGYPGNIFAQDTPPMSHYVIVADTFDACLCFRPYRMGHRMRMIDIFEEVAVRHTKPKHPLNILIAAALAYELHVDDAKRILRSVYSSDNDARIIDVEFARLLEI